ncbi:MAG: hypothetical protein HOV80_17665 [Polyangiaceae bacterium]|nr:hypothetical protein [Polyangiaceae bacterium]
MTQEITGTPTWRESLTAPDAKTRRNAESIQVLAQDVADCLAFLKKAIPSAFSTLLPVKVVATSEVIPLEGEFNVDGVDLVDGDSILLTDNAFDNIVYIVRTGAWVPRADFAPGSLIVGGASVLVTNGTHAGRTWIVSGSASQIFVVGTNPLTWTEPNPLGQASESADPFTLVVRDENGDGTFRYGHLDQLLGRSNFLLLAGGAGATTQISITSNGQCFGNGSPAANQGGSTRFVGVTGPSGDPAAGSGYVWWNDTAKSFQTRDSAGVVQTLASEEAEFVHHTAAGAAVLVVGKINVLSGAVTSATLPAIANGSVVVVQKRGLTADIVVSPTGGGVVINGAANYTLSGSYAAATFTATTQTANEWLTGA